MRTAVVYDYLPANEGGGERALLEIIAHFDKNVHIYFGFVVDSQYSRKTLNMLRDTYGADHVHTGPTVRWFKPILFRIMNFLLPELLQSFDLQSFDLVFSFTAFLSHSIIPPIRGKHILYMNTPARFLWNLQHAHSLLKIITSPLLITDIMRFRSQLYDLTAIEHMNTIVGISTAVQQRIFSFYNRESKVLHPPSVSDEILKADLNDSAITSEFGNYFMYAGRIESYKNLDLLVDLLECNELKENIIIVGDGPYLNNIRTRLRRLFGRPTRYRSSSLEITSEKYRNVYVTGYIHEAKKMAALANASAFFSLNDEDFGITKVEALAVGTPVIALNAGGAIDLVKDSTNGVLFAEATQAALMQAIERHRQIQYNTATVRRSAKPFTISAFHVNLDKVLYA